MSSITIDVGDSGVMESFEMLRKDSSSQFAPARFVSKEEARAGVANQQHGSPLRKLWNHLKQPETALILLICLGAAIGIVIGSFADSHNETLVLLIKFPGEIFMRMLKMMIVPIIISSIITGLTSIDIRRLKRVGIHAMAYYLTTTLIAVILGIVLVVTIKPGDTGAVKANVNLQKAQAKVSTLDTFLDLIRNIFPDNLFAALFSGVQTKLVGVDVANSSTIEFKRVLMATSSTNTLGLIVFSIFFGAVISSLGKEGRVVKDFFNVLNTVFMKIILMFLWISPVGVGSLIAGNLLSHLSLKEMMATLGLYMATVLIGLLIHSLIILPSIYFFITRKNPLTLFRKVFKAILIALGTASSAGTLPVTMECLNNYGVNEQISNLVLPLGATMNMDGTALLEGVASITIAQMNGMELSITQIIIIR